MSKKDQCAGCQDCHSEVRVELSFRRKPKTKRYVQPGLVGGSHDQSGQQYDCEGKPRNIAGTQYKNDSNYVGRLKHLQLVSGTNGMLDPKVSCHYCKDSWHINNNCIHLNKQVMAAKQANKKDTGSHISKK